MTLNFSPACEKAQGVFLNQQNQQKTNRISAAVMIPEVWKDFEDTPILRKQNPGPKAVVCKACCFIIQGPNMQE